MRENDSKSLREVHQIRYKINLYLGYNLDQNFDRLILVKKKKEISF